MNRYKILISDWRVCMWIEKKKFKNVCDSLVYDTLQETIRFRECFEWMNEDESNVTRILRINLSWLLDLKKYGEKDAVEIW
jgi:hypothetical protein